MEAPVREPAALGHAARARGNKSAFFMYGRTHPPLSRAGFLRRIARHGAVVLALLPGSLVLGMAGYMYFEQLAWRDAFLNTAM
jgi:transcriptional regulator GlxA family with amidase domain